MIHYLIRRLLLLPITLFFIILVNFLIINLAPGDPVTISDISKEGGAQRQGHALAFGSDDRYLIFREFYGLTLPILVNTWPWLSQNEVNETLWKLANRKESPQATQEMNYSDYDKLRIKFGDQARYILPLLLNVIKDEKRSLKERQLAIRYFQRGTYRNAYIGANLSESNMAFNRSLSENSNSLNALLDPAPENAQQMNKLAASMQIWYEAHKGFYTAEPTTGQKISMFFFQTRFFRYMSRVLTLDFGTLRSDPNKSVISEVTKRFKYSLTLSIIPMIITFALCLFFGFLMALQQNRWPDYSLNVTFLVLYAIPIFVAAPFLIEKVGLNHYFPFTKIPIPISGFTSPDRIYDEQVSYQRLFDVLQHIFLPIIAIMYGTLASQARLSRTAVLEVLRQDYVRTAWAKGSSLWTVMTRHVGRNASITIVTSIAGSLGIILGGSLIVETLFEINGFGKFFYDAVVNRDYNVIMFSALAGSFLTLLGYLVADIAYTVLDPRITLD
jgi:peptide/nickel transport system permease protein